MWVHSSIWHQASQVNATISAFGAVARSNQSLVLDLNQDNLTKQLASEMNCWEASAILTETHKRVIFDWKIDANDVLVYWPTGTDVKMAHLNFPKTALKTRN